MRRPRRRPSDLYRVYDEEDYLNNLAALDSWDEPSTDAPGKARGPRRIASVAALTGAVSAIGGVLGLAGLRAHSGLRAHATARHELARYGASSASHVSPAVHAGGLAAHEQHRHMRMRVALLALHPSRHGSTATVDVARTMPSAALEARSRLAAQSQSPAQASSAAQSPARSEFGFER